MTETEEPLPLAEDQGDGPGLLRTIALTDAVVAIAMTLLVLPLVEVAGEVDPDDVWSVVSERSDLLLSFVISFAVVYVFWAAQGTAVRRLERAGVEAPGWRALNLLWLLVIAFLPFPTALVGRAVTTGTAVFYIGTMFVLSLLTSAITVVVDREVGPSGRARWGWLTTAVFAVCAAISAVDADAGLLALLALLLLTVAEVWSDRHRSAR